MSIVLIEVGALLFVAAVYFTAVQILKLGQRLGKRIVSRFSR